MMDSRKAQQLITEAIAKFPHDFKLRGMGNDTFRISPSSSYVNDSGEVMLYTQIRRGEQWLDYAKGTQQELTRQIATS